MKQDSIIPHNFRELSKDWQNYSRYKYKESTFALYSFNLEKYIIPYLGLKSLMEIDALEIENFSSYLKFNGKVREASGLKHTTINNILTVLRQIIVYGIDKYNLSWDAHFVKFSKNTHTTSKIISTADWIKLQHYLYNEKSYVGFGILLSMYTGIRIGELCSLQWRDIDSQGILSITKTLLRIRNTNYIPGKGISKTKIIIEQPKTTSSIRYIPLPSTLILKAELFQKNPDCYILTNSSKYMEPRLLQYKFKRYLEKCNIPVNNFHVLRHSFATSCIESGMDFKTLSEILGHSSVKTTLSIYMHSSMELKKKQIELFSQNMFNYSF